MQDWQKCLLGDFWPLYHFTCVPWNYYKEEVTYNYCSTLSILLLFYFLLFIILFLKVNCKGTLYVHALPYKHIFCSKRSCDLETVYPRHYRSLKNDLIWKLWPSLSTQIKKMNYVFNWCDDRYVSGKQTFLFWNLLKLHNDRSFTKMLKKASFEKSKTWLEAFMIYSVYLDSTPFLLCFESCLWFVNNWRVNPSGKGFIYIWKTTYTEEASIRH